MVDEVVLEHHVRELFFQYDRGAPLEPEERVEEADGLRVLRFTISSIHGQRVPGVLITDAERTAPRPLILMLHGAGGSKDEYYIRDVAKSWAPYGFACAAIDAPHHGERATRPFDFLSLLSQPYAGRDHAVQAVVDLRRTLDYLETRPEVDPERTGFLGFSMGTILGVPFCALDRRVKAACFTIGGAGVWTWAAQVAAPDVRRDATLVAQLLDPAHFAPYLAPRPVLMVNGTRDELIPRRAAELLYESLREPKRIIWYDGGHADIPRETFREIYLFFRDHLTRR